MKWKNACYPNQNVGLMALSCIVYMSSFNYFISVKLGPIDMVYLIQQNPENSWYF